MVELCGGTTGGEIVRKPKNSDSLTSKIGMRRLNVVLVRSSLSLSLSKFLLLLSSGSIISLSLTFSLLFPNRSRGLILVFTCLVCVFS